MLIEMMNMLLIKQMFKSQKNVLAKKTRACHDQSISVYIWKFLNESLANFVLSIGNMWFSVHVQSGAIELSTAC